MADDQLDCDNNAQSTETLLRSIFTIEDVTGKIGVRTVAGTDSGDAAIDCDNYATMTAEQLLRKSIVATPSGPAIRLLS